MASKYSNDFKVPKEFPSVLKAFTREVLRNQPDNIYEFGAQYFTTLLQELEEAEGQANGQTHSLTPTELEELLATLFREADKDGSGALSLLEFKEVIEMANLPLSKAELSKVLAEADVNNDGEIDYAEFIPIAVELVQGCLARAEQAVAEGGAEEEARLEAEELMLHGMSRTEMEQMMADVFKRADKDHSGALSLSEFHQCIREADLGFTRKEINALMHSVDVSRDGEVSYAEFVPLCFELIVEIMKDELIQAQPPSELEQQLHRLCVGADPEQRGTLPTSTLRDLIKSADLGLTRLQIHLLMSEAEEDEEGNVDYAAVLPAIAGLAHRLLDLEAQKERKAAVSKLQEEVPTVHGHTAEEVHMMLEEPCAAADVGGAGMITRAELRQALVGSTLGLSPKEVAALMSAVDADAGGYVEYPPLLDFAFKLLLHVEQQG